MCDADRTGRRQVTSIATAFACAFASAIGRWVWAAKHLVAWLLVLGVGVALAQDVLPIPVLNAHVIDQTGTLDAQAQQSLEAKLSAFERDKGSQIVIYMVATTQPEDISSFANRVGNTWKIGRKGVGDGLLLIVAKNDRRVRIEVAKTLEGAIPDLAAKQIIDSAITPNFKLGNYAAGLEAAVLQIQARISGEALPAPSVGKKDGFYLGDFQWTDLAIFLFFAVPIAGGIARSIFGRKLGSVLTGTGVGALAMAITASLVVAGVAGVIALVVTLLTGHRSFGSTLGRTSRHGGGWGSGGFGGNSGGFGGGGGGGFSSGGGGDFGGGGASGDW
jgi:uncharacterized protein